MSMFASFFIELFFLISAFFTPSSFRKKGATGYIKNSCKIQFVNFGGYDGFAHQV